MGKHFSTVKSWLVRLAFLAALLCVGFLAEYAFYRSTSIKTGHPPATNGSQKIVVIGGSVSHALDYGHLEKALRLAAPKAKYSAEFLSYPFFSAHNLPGAYEFANSLQPSIILLQIGCDDIAPPTSSPSLRNEIPAWLFLRSNRKKPLPPELVNLNHDLAAILKNLIETNDSRGLWQFVPFLKKYIEHRVAISELRLLDQALYQSALKMRIDGSTRGTDSAMAILQIGNLLRGRSVESENASGQPHLLEKKIAWLKDGWRQIGQGGCLPFARADAPDVYDRIGLCWVRERHPNSSLVGALEVEGWLIQSLFGGTKMAGKLDSDPLLRLIEVSVAEPTRTNPESNKHEIDPISMRLLEMKIREVAELARTRNQRLMLLHYPNINYAFVDHLAGVAKVRAVGAADLFPAPITEQNRRTYFVDDLRCGNGHLTDFGSDFWAKRVADAVLREENN